MRRLPILATTFFGVEPVVTKASKCGDEDTTHSIVLPLLLAVVTIGAFDSQLAAVFDGDSGVD